MVHHIPFTHLKQLLPLLQVNHPPATHQPPPPAIRVPCQLEAANRDQLTYLQIRNRAHRRTRTQHLRQQLVFNELFTSCFSDQRSANAAGKRVPAAHGPEAVPQGTLPLWPDVS